MIKSVLLTKSYTFKINHKGNSYFICNDKDIQKKFEDFKNIKIPEDNPKLRENFKIFLQFFENFQKNYERRSKNKNNNIEIILEFNRNNVILKYKNEEYAIYNKDDLNADNGFNSLMDNINYDEFSSEQHIPRSSKTTNEQTISIDNSNKSYDDIIIRKKQIKTIDNSQLTQLIKDLLQKENKYQILNIKNIIGHHEKPAEFIKETKNGILISGSMNNILYLYNSKNDLIKEIEINPKEPNNQEPSDNSQREKYKIKNPLNIYEKSIKNENIEQIIVCTKTGLISFDINEDEKEIVSCGEQKLINNEACSTYFELDNDCLLTGGEKGIICSNKEGEEKNIIKSPFRGGIKINENIIAFSSNMTLPYGNDHLVFYDIKSNKKIYEIRDYSFTISTNSLSIMETNHLFVLLCGCKKYREKTYHKNGILLVDLSGMLNNDKKFFLETDDFQVYCFCPISYKINKEDIYYTDYFLAGGFSQRKNEGTIKLYKIKKDEKKIVIEFLQDIIFEEKRFELKENPKDNKGINGIRDKKIYFYFNRFERTVSCITQSKLNRDIYITCWDGNVFLCEEPNIGYYLDLDIEEEKIYENKR